MKYLLLSCFLVSSVFGQSKPEVNYEYKKYEKFDLGNLEVKGELLAPGDVSIREREREAFELNLFERKHSEDLARSDVRTIR